VANGRRFGSKITCAKSKEGDGVGVGAVTQQVLKGNRRNVPKRRHIKFRRRRIKQKKKIQQNAHLIFKTLIPENHALYEIMWENIVQPDRTQMTVRGMRTACCIHKATNTQAECEILIAVSG
jgi:hypothetical protein